MDFIRGIFLILLFIGEPPSRLWWVKERSYLGCMQSGRFRTWWNTTEIEVRYFFISGVTKIVNNSSGDGSNPKVLLYFLNEKKEDI